MGWRSMKILKTKRDVVDICINRLVHNHVKNRLKNDPLRGIMKRGLKSIIRWILSDSGLKSAGPNEKNR